jgi:hypothetical protein
MNGTKERDEGTGRMNGRQDCYEGTDEETEQTEK